MIYRKAFSVIAGIGLLVFGVFGYLAYETPEFASADTSSTLDSDNATAGATCGNDNWAWVITSTDLQTNDTAYVQQTTNRFDSTDVSDQLNALDYQFTGLSGTIDGIQFDMYGWSPNGGTVDFTTVQVTTDSGTTLEGTNQFAGALSTSDDDSYDTFGGSTDNWGGVITPTEAMTAAFGVGVCWTAGTNNAEVNVDHARMIITYTPSTGRRRVISFLQGDKYIGNGQFQQVRYGKLSAI